MTNTNRNDPNEFIDAVSQTVKEVPYNVTGQMTNRQINRLIAFYPYNIRFGQSRPCLPDRQRFSNIRHFVDRMGTRKGLALSGLLLAIFCGSILLAMNIPSLDTEGIKDDNQQSMGLIMKEEDKCHCSNEILEDKLHANTNDEIIDFIMYDEPDVANMFKEIPTTEDVDGSTCALYDLFLSVFTKLCSVKGIISILPDKPEDDNYSIDDIHEKSGETLPSTDNLSSSKIEQNGAVSTEDTHSTNVHIPKETYPLSTNEEFLEKNVT